MNSSDTGGGALEQYSLITEGMLTVVTGKSEQRPGWVAMAP